jgi:hypothetical protein
MTKLGCRAAAAATAVALGATAAPANAKISALPSVDSQFRKGATKLAKSIAAKPRWVRRGRFSLLPPGGRPAALSTTELADFPREGKSYAILSNGDARLAGRRNRSTSTSRGNGGPFVRGTRDTLIFRIDLRVPSNANCLSFRFRFLTEEFPEYVGSEFNDGFIAELGSSSWDATSNQDPTIIAPGNFALDPNSRLITVNGAGDAAVDASSARGTTYDGATGVLRASTPVREGKRRQTLYLSIFDQGDRQYDSSVFVDNLTLDRQESCQAGVVSDA